MALTASAALLAALIVASRWVDKNDAPATVLLLGALIEVMLLTSPVCHLHYFCLSVPLMAGILGSAWKNVSRPQLGKWLSALVAIHIVANAIPHFPGMEPFRDIGIAGYAALLLVTAAAWILWRRGRTEARSTARTAAPLKSAA